MSRLLLYGFAGTHVSKASIVDKKAAIIDNALRANPGNEELLLVLLVDILPDRCKAPHDRAIKWREALARLGGSARLWSQHFTFVSGLGLDEPSQPLKHVMSSCADSVGALASHAHMAARRAGSNAGQDSRAHEASLRAADCAAADAAARYVTVLLAAGKIADALRLVQSVLECAACPVQSAGMLSRCYG